MKLISLKYVREQYDVNECVWAHLMSLISFTALLQLTCCGRVLW